MTSKKIIGKHLSIFVLCAVTSISSLYAAAEPTTQPADETAEPREEDTPPVILDFCPMFPQCEVEFKG